MKAIIKETFSKVDLASGYLLVTPKSFSVIRNWSDYEVDGLKYYVDKAVSLGAKKPKPKKKADKKETS